MNKPIFYSNRIIRFKYYLLSITVYFLLFPLNLKAQNKHSYTKMYKKPFVRMLNNYFNICEMELLATSSQKDTIFCLEGYISYANIARFKGTIWSKNDCIFYEYNIKDSKLHFKNRSHFDLYTMYYLEQWNTDSLVVKMPDGLAGYGMMIIRGKQYDEIHEVKAICTTQFMTSRPIFPVSPCDLKNLKRGYDFLLEWEDFRRKKNTKNN